MLMDTVRDQMRAARRARTLPLLVADAAKLLGFSNVKDFEAYARDRESGL